MTPASALTRHAVLALLLLTGFTAAPAQRLRSPWDDTPVTPTDAPWTCPAPPAFAPTLDLHGYYSDKNYSIIDPKLLAAFNEASAGPTHLGQSATNAADAWRDHGSRAAAACVESLLAAAARAHAWDGPLAPHNDASMQNWLLSAAAIAYLKVRDSHTGTPADDAAIQAWFARLAARVRTYFEEQTGHPGSEAWNNHMFWAGLSLAAEGVADNNVDDLSWATGAYRLGVDEIQPDGSLPAEMDRRQMALHYQLYALGPLVMIAELTRPNGLDLYTQQNSALHRLVAFDIAALQDPTRIARRTGIAQTITPPYSGLEIGWAVPWVRRFPNPQLTALLAQAPWTRFWQWGGDPPDPANPPPPLSPADAAFVRRTGDKLAADLASSFPPVSADSPLLGVWCVQSDLAARASARLDAGLLLLTDPQGVTSVAESPQPLTLLAPAFHGIQGALSPDRSQIDWSSGTYWSRCVTRAAAIPLSLSGQWIPMGVRSIVATIRQHGAALQIDSGQGASATGSLDNAGHLTTVWSGHPIAGRVTADGNHILWDNQTWWTRASVYQPPR